MSIALVSVFSSSAASVFGKVSNIHSVEVVLFVLQRL